MRHHLAKRNCIERFQTLVLRQDFASAQTGCSKRLVAYGNSVFRDSQRSWRAPAHGLVGVILPARYVAQATLGRTKTAINQLRSFDTFLRDHPSIAKKLWEKPQRVDDQGFLNGNKELKQWLEDHPSAARVFQGDPADFMARERHFQLYGGDFAAGDSVRNELARFDWFLDSHPDIRHDLMKHPDLARKQGYLASHPALEEFLDRHPGVREELQDRPKEFMAREERYARSM